MQEFTSENPGELSVSKGQQVEVMLDSGSSASTSSSLATLPENNTAASASSPPSSSGMVMVRLSSGDLQGLVPVSCLKLPPGGLQQLRAQRAAAIAEAEAGE